MKLLEHAMEIVERVLEGANTNTSQFECNIHGEKNAEGMSKGQEVDLLIWKKLLIEYQEK